MRGEVVRGRTGALRHPRDHPEAAQLGTCPAANQVAAGRTVASRMAVAMRLGWTA